MMICYSWIPGTIGGFSLLYDTCDFSFAKFVIPLHFTLELLITWKGLEWTHSSISSLDYVIVRYATALQMMEENNAWFVWRGISLTNTLDRKNGLWKCCVYMQNDFYLSSFSVLFFWRGLFVCRTCGKILLFVCRTCSKIFFLTLLAR